MNTHITFCRGVFITLSLLFSAAAYSADQLPLARQKNCMTCHAVNQDVMGPSFKKIADKYRSTPVDEAMKKVTEVIQVGGTGNWGGSMPANKQITDEQAALLAKWILSIK